MQKPILNQFKSDLQEDGGPSLSTNRHIQLYERRCLGNPMPQETTAPAINQACLHNFVKWRTLHKAEEPTQSLDWHWVGSSFYNLLNQLPYLSITLPAQLLQPSIFHQNLQMLPERKIIQIFQVTVRIICHQSSQWRQSPLPAWSQTGTLTFYMIHPVSIQNRPHTEAHWVPIHIQDHGALFHFHKFCCIGVQ